MRNKVETALTNIDDRFIDETITYIHSQGKPFRRIRYVIRRIMAYAAALFILLFGGLSIAAAAGSISAYEILYSLQPDIAVKLLPVNESCEDQGIRMEVEAIHINDNKADIYISLQDITGNRIDETIDLFDSYSIHTNTDQIGGCTLISYDQQTKMATFLITIQQDGDIQGKKINFSVSKLLTGKANTTLELEQIAAITETDHIIDVERLAIRGVGGANSSVRTETDSLLMPNPRQTFSPTASVWITGYGYINGRLHIQAYYENILEYDNHGSILLQAGEMTEYPACNFAFWDDEKSGSYEEYIFDISPDQMENFSIIGNFTTCQTAISGDWHVSFLIYNK